MSINELSDDELVYYILQGTPKERARALVETRKRGIEALVKKGMSPEDAATSTDAAIESTYGKEGLAIARTSVEWLEPDFNVVREAERLKSKYENALSPEEREQAKTEFNMFVLRHLGPKYARKLRQGQPIGGKKSIVPERLKQAASETYHRSIIPLSAGLAGGILGAEYAYSLPYEGAFKAGQYLSEQGFGRRDITTKGSLLNTLAPTSPIKRAQKAHKESHLL